MSEDADQVIREVSRRIAELRQGLGLSMTEFAQRLGVSYHSAYQLEQGHQNLTLRTMVKVAAALETSMFDLLEIPAARRARQKLPGARKP